MIVGCPWAQTEDCQKNVYRSCLMPRVRHPGLDSTLHKLKEIYAGFPKIAVRAHFSNCEVCVQQKNFVKSKGLQSLEVQYGQELALTMILSFKNRRCACIKP